MCGMKPTRSPCPGPSPELRPLLVEEIADLVDSFAHAAKVLYNAGADGTQLVRLLPSASSMSTADGMD